MISRKDWRILARELQVLQDQGLLNNFILHAAIILLDVNGLESALEYVRGLQEGEENQD